MYADLRRPDRRTPKRVLVNKTFTNVQTVWAMYTEHNRTDTRYMYIHVPYMCTFELHADRPTWNQKNAWMKRMKTMRYKMEMHWILLMKWMMISTRTCTYIRVLTHTCTCIYQYTCTLHIDGGTYTTYICTKCQSLYMWGYNLCKVHLLG